MAILKFVEKVMEKLVEFGEFIIKLGRAKNQEIFGRQSLSIDSA